MSANARFACLACLLAPFALANSPAADSKVGFTAEAYVSHIRYLAGDELEGRRPGTPGNEAAAKYIADHFKAIGLAPGGDNGTYFQEFSAGTLKDYDAARANFKLTGSSEALAADTDWTPMPFTDGGDVEGPLAFAGYCIEAPDDKYDDFAGFDAKDKILIAFRHEPKADDEEASFGGRRNSSHSLFASKARVARSHGAKALIIVDPPDPDDETDELYRWSNNDSRSDYELPLMHMTRAAAERVLKSAGLADLKALAAQLKEKRGGMSSDLKGVSAKIQEGVDKQPLLTRNVIGLLPGSGKVDEYVVVGAHFDHLGKVQRWGGRRRGRDTGDATNEPEIHNGADDNASGTAGVLELSRVIASEQAPRRSILFMGFSAEEMGLLGSAHYVAHPTVELSKIKAMYNLDMIGRYRPEVFEIDGTTTAREFADLVKHAAAAQELTYKAPSTNAPYFGSSDHASFYRKDIPVLFPFTGIHKEYHKPDDDVDLINGDGATKILEMSHEIILALANMENGPTFVSKSEEPADSQPADDNAAASQPGRMPRVRLGIVPDMDDTSGGIKVDQVSPGEPAAKAGIRDGDRIIRIAGQSISDLYGYMEVMREQKAGEAVEVVVKRGSEELTFKVTLAE